MHHHKVLLRLPNPFYRPDDDSRLATQIKSVPNALRIYVDWGGYSPLTQYWILNVQFGRGSGCILGRTLYIGRNMRVPCGVEPASLSRRMSHWLMNHITVARRLSRLPVVIGFTDNGNYAPYGDG